MAFGPAFFFWGQHPGEEAGGEGGGAVATGVAAAGRLLQRERLRQLVLACLEAAASLPASSSNLEEVSALLRLLQQHAARHGEVAAACRLLLRLLGAAPATSLAALRERQLLVLLPRLLAQQLALEGEAGQAVQPAVQPAQQAAEAGLAGGSPAPGPAAAQAGALEESRCAALELLGAFMRWGWGPALPCPALRASVRTDLHPTPAHRPTCTYHMVYI